MEANETKETKPIHPDDLALMALEGARKVLMAGKPAERTELSRRYAIAITELEKVIGFFDVFVNKRNYWLESEQK